MAVVVMMVMMVMVVVDVITCALNDAYQAEQIHKPTTTSQFTNASHTPSLSPTRAQKKLEL